MSIYTEFGYENRRNYLESLAEDHGVDLDTVLILSSVLGPSEDFDGLVSAVADIAEETD